LSATQPGKSDAVTDHLASVRRRLKDFLRTREVDRDPRLKIICACLLAYYFLTFFNWWQWSTSLSTSGNEVFDYVPAAVVQNFRWLVFMDAVQTRTYLYLLGMLALLGLFSLFYLRSSLLAMSLMAFLFVNKMYFYLSDCRLFANFHHFHLLFTLMFLVSREKLRFFRGALAVGYIMSGVVKITPSWLFGEYFNSLTDKLPLLPKINWVVTAASAGVFLVELFGPLAWFTSITWLRRLTFGVFILFHLYSGIIVAFWYTTLMLPLVIAAFIRFDRPLQAGYRFQRRDMAPFVIFALVILAGLYHYFLPGDVRLTGEARYYGFFMFDANRQVSFETEIQKGNKTWKIRIFRPFDHTATEGAEDVSTQMGWEFWQNGSLRGKFPVTGPIEDQGQVIFNPMYFVRMNNHKIGDPYYYYFFARELMQRYQPDHLSLHLDVQLNGHSEIATLLDIPDFCKLKPTYDPFWHNDWIMLPDTNSPSAYRWR
jgi:hypothetical protein